ncbi:hypothetical protein DUNSADRAFT_13681 [Dunaliella salina]|uniref:Uncharacterized protein n=1 Tax=Dunaliella salina TaxID=3046 RepID=A0ABQ7G8V0_DUNSA|nr:hypothetical protein DUNSADRAFT_13681 [Dunaliella salina]|eukprot:KAF5831030.1 hypothetical protein DUNSADRAFT_13681 [Dunaliella salina]
MLRELTKRMSGALSVPLIQRALVSSTNQEHHGGNALGAVIADSKAYRAWTWSQYQRVMKYAALIAGVHLLLILRDMDSTYQQLVNIVMIFQMVCLFLLTLKLPPSWKIESHEWGRWVVLSFSLGKIVMTWVLFLSDEHPGDSVGHRCRRHDQNTDCSIAHA